MLFGNGGLFLPIKKSIRELIKKEEGDTVYVEINPVITPKEIPDEIFEILSVLNQNLVEHLIKLPQAKK